MPGNKAHKDLDEKEIFTHNKTQERKSLYSLQKRYANLQMCRRNTFPDLRFTSTIDKALAKK